MARVAHPAAERVLGDVAGGERQAVALKIDRAL